MGTFHKLLDIVYSDGVFLAVAIEGYLYASQDGVSWDIWELEIQEPDGLAPLTVGLARGAGIYAFVGRSAVYISRDLASWSEYVPSVPTRPWFNAIAYGAAGFVAVGCYWDENYEHEMALIVTSKDGSSWDVRKTATTGCLEGVTYGNGIYVAVGGNGTILTSFDAVNWHTADSVTDITLNDVVYGNGSYVAVGEDGVLVVSSDGEQWEVQVSPTRSELRAVAYGSWQFVAVGTNGVILTSQDAKQWSLQPSATRISLTGVAYGDGRFVAIGYGSSVITSP